EVGFVPPYATYPFLPGFFATLSGASPREVLKKCDAHRVSCLRSGTLVELDRAEPKDAGTALAPNPEIAEARRSFQTLKESATIGQLLRDEDEESLDALLEAACQALVFENALPEDVDQQVEHDFLGSGSFEPLHARVRLVYRTEGDREKHLSVRFLQKSHHIA